MKNNTWTLWLYGLLLALPIPAQAAPPTMIRVRLPEKTMLAAAEKLQSDRYSTQLNEANTAAAKAAIAQTMSAAADESQDVAERYALRRRSAAIAAEAGYWREALKECDRLCAEFNVPHATEQAEVILVLGNNASAARNRGLDDAALAALIIDALEGLLVEDDYQTALKLWPFLNARPGFGAMAQEYQSLASRLQQAYNSEAAPALITLKSDPFNAAAHQALGDFYFKHKEDWEAALPHYALGTKSTTKTLALRELAQPQEHRDHAQLAIDYQTAENSMSPSTERTWLGKRARYWRAIAATSEQPFRQRYSGQAPMLPPQQDDVASFAPRVGSNLSRRGTPAGASLLLTFDHPSPLTGAMTKPFMVRPGSGLGGQRTTFFDLSPRRNHVEGMYTGSSNQGIFSNSWRMRSTPLVCSQRLLDQLPAFTWTGWVSLESSSLPSLMFEEPPDIATWPPVFNPAGLKLDVNSNAGVQFLSSLAHTAPATGSLPGFNCRIEQGSPLHRWMFVAVTVDYAQRVRITVNHRSISQAMDLASPRNAQGMTLFGAAEGQLDSVTFYPRPLSQAEITTLYHRGLTRQPLAEYLANGTPTQPPVAEFPPIVYQPADSVASSNPPNTPSTNNSNPPSPAPAAPKTPKPSDDEIKEARALIRDLYAADFTKATNVDKRRELASKLKQVGRDSRDSAASRYACMYEAADLLTDAEVPEAYDAWDELAREFDVPVAREKGGLLDRMQKKAKLPTEHKYLADRYVRLLNEALEDDDYPLALSFGTRAEACVKRAGDEALEKTIDKGIKDVRQMMAAYEVAKPAKEKLATSPDDAMAAFTWGKYLCLYRGKWDEGLLLMAKGSDPLATLATTDHKAPSATKPQTELAAAWWSAADSQTDERAKVQLRSRAVHWYQKVVGSTSGIQAEQIKQRIADHQAAISPIPTKKPFDALSMVDVMVHGLTGRWQRDRNAIATLPDQNRGSELIVPVALHGSYEFATRIEWQGQSGALVIRLPVGDKTVLLTVGNGMDLENARGNNLQGVKAVHPSMMLDRGRRYEVTAAVNVNDDNADITVALNTRPYLSWNGSLKDLDTNDFGGGFGPGRFGPGGFRPNRGGEAASSEPIIRFHGRNGDPYAISSLQLNVTRGWAEPVLRPVQAIGLRGDGF